MNRVSINAVLDDTEYLQANHQPASTTHPPYMTEPVFHPERIQFSSDLGSIFFSIDAARATVAVLQAALAEAEAVRS